MKYALCFRGISYYKDYYHADSPQLFDVDFSQSLGSFQKNIINPLKETGNDVDIFFTTYDSVKLQDYIDIMKPKAVKLNSYQYLRPGTWRNVLTMFIDTLNLIKNTNIYYDYIIRIRFDITPKDKLICSNYDSNFIHYLDMNHQDELISDWLNFGSNSIMNVYSSLFLHMNYLNKYTFYKKEDRLLNLLEPSDECGGLYEHMLRDLMHLHKIPKQAIKLNCGLA